MGNLLRSSAISMPDIRVENDARLLAGLNFMRAPAKKFGQQVT